MNKNFTQKHLFFLALSCLLTSSMVWGQTPGGIANTNIKLWLKADSGITNVAGVKQWNDLGPAGKHLIQNTANARPVYNTASNLVNYNPTVKFDGSNDFMSVTPGILGTATYNNLNVFMVRNVPSNSNALAFTERCNPYHFAGYSPWGDANMYWDGGHYVAPYRQSVNWGGTFGIPQQISLTYDVTPTKSQTIRRNGKQLISDATATAFLGTNQPFYLGRWHAGGYHDNAFVSEMLVVGGVLSATEKQKIESYLALKYGITIDQTVPTNYLASDGSTIWNGGVTGNKNNIAGIGRDNGSGLYQKQSRSVNTANSGNMVWMGLNTIAATNTANTGTLTNNSFMLWGDNGSSGTQTSEVPSSLTNGGCVSVQRMTREWIIQETGTVGAVQVKFNLTGFTSATTTQSEIKLLIDDDGNFGNGGTTIVEATYYDPVTKELTFDNVNFSHASYFTVVLDLAPSSPGGVSSGLALWLKADKGVSVNGSNNLVVSNGAAWTDQSPNARHIDYVYSDPQWKDNSINFNPVIEYDGNDWMRIDNATKKSFYTSFTSGDVFSVARNYDVANRSSLYYLGGASFGHHYTWSNGYIYSGYGTNVRKAWHPNNATPPIAEGAGMTSQGPAFNPMHVNIFNQHSATNNWRAFFNGRQQVASSSSTVNFANNGNVYIAAYPGLGNYWGIIPEIINFNRVLTDPEKNRVNSYLAVKYGLTLDQTVAQNYTAADGTTIFWNAASNTTYKNNIVGIGRDDCGGLYQKQSRGSLTGTEVNMVGIGLDSIKTSNLNNKSTFSADKSFLMIAHDGTTGTKTTELPTSFANPCITYTRVNKEWRVQKTGTVGTMNVRLYYGDLSIYSDDISEYKLIIDGDADFSNATNIISASSINPAGKFVDFYGVTLNDGQFFTFLVDQAAAAPGGVLTPTASEINGVKYDLYTGLETVTDGIQSPLRNSGYMSTLTNPDDLVLNEIYDYFTMKLTTNLKIVNPGQYQFRFVAADDNVQLLIDGVNYMNRTCCGDVTGANITLTAGNHLLEVRFSEYVGGETLQLQWRAAATGLDVTTTWQAIAENKLFLPAAPSLSAWFRADKNVTATGNGVIASGWKDQSANANNLTTRAGNNPIYYNTTSAKLANYNPSIAFTTDQMYSTDNPVGFAYGKQGKTTFSVMSKPVYNSGSGWVSALGRDNCSGCSFGTYTTGTDIGATAWTAANDVISTGYLLATDNNVAKLLMGSYANSNITTTNNMSIWANGLQKNIATRLTNNTTLNDNEDFSIGTHNDFQGGGVDQDIMEVIHYPWTLTAAERSRVQSYLAIKYGITLDQTTANNYVDGAGSTIWDATANSTYKFNITGIGRDDCSGLKQKQSKSENTINTGNLVAIGRDTIANSNGENNASFTADKSFLIWGDDNGGVTEVSTEIPTSITAGSVCTKGKRIAREWKVAVTNYSEHNMVQFNLARLNLLTRATSEFKLMVDADGDFTNGATLYSPTSKVDSFLNFDNITFTNGQFFSLLTSDDEVTGPGGVTSTIAWWYKGDVGFTSGATTTWEDNSSSGLHLTQATVSRQPLNTKYQNYNKVVTYDGSDAMNNAVGYWKSSTGNTAFNFYAVTKRITGQGSVNTLFAENTNQGDHSFFNGYNANRFYSNLWAGRYAYTSDPPAKFISGTPLLVSSRYSSIGSIHTIAINGLNESLTGVGAFTTFNGTNSNLVIGNHINQSSWPFEGDIAEIMMFPSDLSASDRNKVESYLAIKWGTTLNQSPGQNYVASNSTTKFYDTAVMTTYKNNIAGLGRDLCAGLHQKQSRSVNRSSAYDSIVAMGLTEIYTGNEENPDTLANLSFMMWADDGASGSQVTEVPTALTNGGCIQVKRLSREWRVQETGTVGAVQVQMNLGGVIPKSTEIGDIRLLIDNDNNFGNGGTTIVTPTTYDETTRVATFDNINFTDGQFFTITTNIAAGGPGGVITATGDVNGVSYDLYGNTDADLTNGVQGTIAQSGYINNLTNPDDVFDTEMTGAFALVLKTKLSITGAGNYDFQFLSTDDRAFLMIDGVQRINGTGTLSATAINLTAGYHDVEVRYAEDGGTNTLNLQWRNSASGGGTDATATYAAIADNKLFLPSAPSISSWHRADKGIDNAGEGTAVTSWEDQSANGVDLTTGSGTPLYYRTTSANLSNYNPNILFTSDQLQSADNISGFAFGKQGKTTFSVMAKPIFNAGAGWVSALGQDNCNGCSFGTYTDGDDIEVVAWGGATYDVAATNYLLATDNNVPKLLMGSYANNNITTSNNMSIWANGTQRNIATRASNTTTLNDLEDFSIGMHNQAQGGAVNHNIMEVIHYPWVLSFAERQRVNSYLAIKYGITLDTTYVASDATAIWNDVANAGYGNNIAGIGLDSCSGLNQKQSRSVNAVNDGSMVAIGNYAIANSNSENTNNFSADKTFMIWGDDGATGTKVTEVPSAALDPDACRTYKRLNREWKVQETKTVGDVETRFYLGNTYSTAASTINDFKLLVKNNSSDFSSGVTVYNPTSWDATNKYVTFANINFANNDFFTLIIDITSTNPGGVTYTPGDGSVGNPYKTIYDASSNTSAGVKNFNINGNTFTTYVDASGYVLVASGENTTDENGYTTTTALTLQSDKVLTPALLNVLDINTIRMNNTGGGAALDVTTSNYRFINRIINNQVLSQGVNDQTLWTGTGTSLMTVGTAVGSVALTTKIWHSNGSSGHLHWIPSDGSGGATGDGFANSADDADLNLWVRNTNHPITAWYRADKGVTLATGVSNWEDQSINARNATQATIANQPSFSTTTNLINFNPSLNFDGGDFVTFNSIGLATGSAPRTMIGVGTTASTDANWRYMYAYGTVSVANQSSAIARQLANSITVGWSSEHTIASVWNNTTDPHLIYGDYNGTQARGAFDGGSITGTARTWNTQQLSLSEGYVGVRSGGENWLGRIGEIVSFNYVLGSTDLQKLNSYLALKYGLTLNQTSAQDYLASDGTTKMWNATANATYKNRIAGLGRDDCSGLYQKQSQSQTQISDSTVLSMALSSFETSNAANLNTIDSNKTFLVWGDDAGALAEQSTEIPATLNANGTCNQGLRIGREWKVQQTAGKEIGFLQVKMDIDALGLNTTRAVNKFRLVTNNTSDFTTATNFIEPASFTSGVLTFDNVQFTDTVTYLTLVTDTTLTFAPGGVLAGLQAWYKAEVGVTTSTGVDNWTDQSLFGRNAVQATGANQPVYNTTGNKLINFNPSITSTGTQYLGVTGNIPMVNMNAFVVARRGAQNTWNTFFRGPSADHQIMVGPSNDNLGYYDNSTATNKTSGFNIANGQTSLIGAYTRTTGTQGWNSLNGKNGTIHATINEADAGGIFALGNYQAGTQPYGDMSEIAVYNTAAMTAAERQRVESYMALKYGITIDQTVATDYLASDGTTKMWTATGGDNPFFSKNIAGIGRDYCSGLYQKQSRSINMTAVEDSMVAMALTGFEATNADNTSTIDTNLSFMVWGDNGLTGTTTSEVPTAALDALGCKTFKRLRREWKVQETKTINTVALRFHLGTTYSNSNSAVADFKLLVDTDSTFDNATTIISASSYDAANKIVEFSYNFANNDYFTLVIDNAVAPGGVNTNLALWLNASKGTSTTTDNSALTVWNDQSVNNMNATGVNNPLFRSNPTGYNFNPTVQFNGTNQYYNLPTGFNDFTAGLTAFSVLNTSTGSVSAWGRILHLSSAATNANAITFNRENATNNLRMETFNSTPSVIGTLITTSLPLASASTGIYSTRIQSGTSGQTARTSDIFLNGLSIANNSTHATPTTISRTTCRVGAGGSAAAEFINGQMPELILYTRDLTAIERQRVNSYLAIKYGRTLDQTSAQNYLASDGTTISWDATSADNATYKNRIAGIGRDDCSGLDQRQSQSQDSISSFTVLTAGLDTIRTSNALNASEFINNLSFLMWGDDNGALTEQTTEVPTVLNVGTCGAGKRIGREWKVQKTGTVDAVQMKFDINRTSINTRDMSRFRLAVHGTSDFTAATTFYRPSSFISGVLTFDGISFTADSAYMTIITDTIVNIGPGGVVANLNLWITANAGTSSSTNGAAVATWINQAPLGDSLTAAATLQPLFRDGTTTSAFNYNPSLDFDGANDFYAGTSNYGVTGTSPFTTFAIGRRASQATIDMLWGQSTPAAPTGSASFYKGTTHLTAIDGAASIGAKNGVATHGTGIPFLIGLNRSASTTFQLYNAGTVDGTASNLPNSFSGNILTSNLNIGKRVDFEFDGDIAEQVIYGQSLSGTDMQKVNSYLALKYGITMNQGASGLDYLASNGSVIWTGNSTYRFNIAGIGLDSCSALNQKQSHSEDTFQRGEIVAIGKGTISTDNASNGVLFDANRDFLVWGADSARGFKNTEFPASITSQACVSISRLQKEWKTQVTGTSSQTTQVKFFLSGLIPSSTSILDLKLLVDTVDAVFDNGGTRIIDAAAYNETTQEVTFDNVVFKNNNYFTLLIDVYAIAPGGVTSGIKAWVRADKGVTVATGTEVSQWNDQSVNNNTFTQGVSANRPAYNSSSNLLNFNPTLSFDGSSDFMDATTFRIKPDSSTLFAVAQPNTFATNNRAIMSSGAVSSTQGSEYLLAQTTGNLIYGENDGTFSSVSSSALTVNTPYLFSTTATNATNGVKSYVNGLAQTAGTLTKNPTTANLVSIGSRTLVSRGLYFGGLIPEVAIYDGEMSAANRNKVESYLAIKYGFTLDQTTPANYTASFGSVVWDATANAAYNKRIFGIGRDFCSGLYQKQSRSALSGGILTVSLNTMAASNAVNTGTLAKDSMFTIIGDNDSTLTQQSSDLPTTISSCASRLKREWKAQVTGDAVEAEYRFDLSTATGIGTTLTDFRIIIDEDGNGDFTNGIVRIFDASSFASNIVTFSDLKINNGEVFTLVTKGATVGQVALTTTSTKVTSLSDGCSVNGWTYYTDPVDTTKLVIAIFNNGNTVNVDSITINTGSGFTDADLSKGRKTPDERAVSIMKRLIQVNAPGTFTVNGGVKVRLYYDQTEVDDVTTRMNQLKTDSSIAGSTLPWRWFKTKKTITQIVSTMSALGVDPGTPDSTRVTWSLAGDSSGIENGVKFIQLHGIKTFSTFGGGVSVANSTPLPVELLDFTGEKKDDASHLRWQTASEKNVDRFEIERTTQPSANDWEKLGEVKAVGNSRFIQDYSFVDLYPERAMNYYRLKIIDNDAIVDYSKVIALDYRKLGLSNITVYPNPVSESFFIDAKGHDKEKITLKMYDALGRVVWSESYQVRGTYDKREFYRPAQATSGIYMLKLVNESTQDESSVQLILK